MRDGSPSFPECPLAPVARGAWGVPEPGAETPDPQEKCDETVVRVAESGVCYRLLALSVRSVGACLLSLPVLSIRLDPG